MVVSLREENDIESQSTCEDEKEWSESHHGFPVYVKMEILPVEWACGKGLIVLPPTTSQ